MNTKTLLYQGTTWELSSSHISTGVNAVAPKATYDLVRLRTVDGIQRRLEVFAGYSEDRALDYLHDLWGSRPTARLVMNSFNEVADHDAKIVRPTTPRPSISGLPRSPAEAFANL